MVSSTFTDLVRHRNALINAISSQGFKAEAMEHDSAKPDGDVVDSSLQMVRDASAYIGVISHKYGQVPACPERNPDGLSLTELEFNEARRLERPVLVFIMGDDHPVKRADVETDPDKMVKLEAFRANAKRAKADSPIHRVYQVFNDVREFEVAAMQAVADLRRSLERRETPREEPTPSQPEEDELTPTPPAFYPEPPYIASHEFVGRRSQLETLGDWAGTADPHPVLLFEAIGGTGKSMLTWEWTTKYATKVRDDWAGRFWYSFYEKGAIMADFCQCALAYITGKPRADLRKKKTAELGGLLLHELKARPWLLILDGLERVLVAYQRFDAAQLADEEAGQCDKIARRDPCSSIRPEDDELLRAFTSAAPSKLLLTSRLVPRVLLNSASQPLPGVLRERLPGLRPADAEALLRACGISGTSRDIRDYVQRHCDCHPLVIGVLAGIIRDYLPDRGNFDAWASDPAGGGELNLADLDLVQKRNNILFAALDALPSDSRQLLSTLALLSESVDYPTLCALDPHSPQQHEPEEVTDRSGALARTVADLERRGLLQYDAVSKRYDLHPVVRGVTVGLLRQDERDRYGERVIDYFERSNTGLYEEAETLEDLRDGLNVVRTLIQMGRFKQAFREYGWGLSTALVFNVEAYAEVLALVGPLFSEGWSVLPADLDDKAGSYLASNAGVALLYTGQAEEALQAFGASISADLRSGDWRGSVAPVISVCRTLAKQNRMSAWERCLELARGLAELRRDTVLFRVRADHFSFLARMGRWAEAEAEWRDLSGQKRFPPRAVYRPGLAEQYYAQYRFWRGDLEERHLDRAERLAKSGKSRKTLRDLYGLRGEWQLESGNHGRAEASLQEAVRMARSRGQLDARAEALLVSARVASGKLKRPRDEIERVAAGSTPFHRAIAALWWEIGEKDRALTHAMAAYKWAWGDGAPYVHHYELEKARELLEQFGAGTPDLPEYESARHEPFSWEAGVAATIRRLRSEGDEDALLP